jgi:virginiamycin B lyase
MLTVLATQSSSLVQEFDVPTLVSQPQGITLGPDGNLWFTQFHTDKIARITSGGVVTEYSLPPNTGPWGITAALDGNIWFTEQTANQIGRITPSGVITHYPLPTSGAVPMGITKGTDGNVWFTEFGKHKIGRITPGGVITEYQTPTSGSGPRSITSGPNGDLWFTESFANRVGKISTIGAIEEYVLKPLDAQPAGSSPKEIAFGPDGNLWVTATGAVWKVTGAGLATPHFLPDMNSDPVGIAQGPDGNLWFAENWGDRISRLTVGGIITQYALPRASSGPAYVAVGSDGNVWFSESIAGRIGKLVLSAIPSIEPLGISQSLIVFNGVFNSSAPTAQPLSILSSAPRPFVASAAVASPIPWLTISPSGNLSTNQTITVSANPAGLRAGSYVGTILLTSGNVTHTVIVTFNVTAAGGNVSVQPVTLNFASTVGDAVSAVQTLVISNATPGAGPRSVTITKSVSSPSGGKWLILPDTTVTVPDQGPSGSSLEIPVQVDSTGLSAGVYQAAIGIVPAGGTPVLVPVALRVTTPFSVSIMTVVNAASGLHGDLTIAPGEIVSIFGTGLGPISPLGLALDSSGKVATSIGGVTVSFNGHPAPLTYVSASQINCVVPYEVDGVSDVVPVEVQYSGRSGRYGMRVKPTMLGIFTVQNGSGTPTVAAINSTGGYNGPDNPALAGSTITFYLTGEGQTNPRGITGKVTTVDTTSGGPLTPQSLAGAPTVTIGGERAAVLFYGAAPGMVAGVMQLNVRIPVGLPSGILPLLVSFGDVSSQPGVTVWVH